MQYLVSYKCYTSGARDMFPAETSATVKQYPEGRDPGYRDGGTFDNLLSTSDGPFDTIEAAVESAKKDLYVTYIMDGTKNTGYDPYPILWEMKNKVHPKFRNGNHER